jgi:hypothetical protein
MTPKKVLKVPLLIHLIIETDLLYEVDFGHLPKAVLA